MMRGTGAHRVDGVIAMGEALEAAAAGCRPRVRCLALATGGMLAGLAALPAGAQVLDLGGQAINRTELTTGGPYSVVTNGQLRLTPGVAGVTYNGGLDDSGGVFSLTKLGSNTLRLGGTGLNSFSGTTLVSAGLLQATAVNVLSPQSLLNIAVAGRVDLGGFDQQVAGLTGQGALQNSGGPANLTIATTTTNSYRGVISGATRVIKTGVGVQGLTGVNTYTGGTELAGGLVNFLGNSAFGTGAITVTGPAAISPLQQGATVANAIILQNALELRQEGITSIYSGRISGSGSLVKTGFGEVSLVKVTGAPDNSFTGGIDLQRGQINVGYAGALGTGTLAATGGQVGLGVVGDISVAIQNNIALGGLLGVDLPGAGNIVTLDGVISGPGRLFLQSGAGTLLLTNAGNSFTGGVQALSGVLGLANSAALGSGQFSAGNTASLAAYGNLVIDNDILLRTPAYVIDTRGFDVELSGAILNNVEADPANVSGIVKRGNGRLTLSGASGYTGTTVVEAGTLILTGSLAETDVVIRSGAIVTGSGAIGGDVILDNGAIFDAVGNTGGAPTSIELGSLVLNPNSIRNVQLGAANIVGGPLNDLIVVDGNLTLDGFLNVTQTQAPGAVFGPGRYRLFDFGGSLVDNGLILNPLPGGFSGFIEAGINPGQVNLVVRFGNGTAIYWDGTNFAGNGVIDGGNGVWNAANTNWTGDAPSNFNTSWQNAIGIFAGTAGTVTIDGPQAFTELRFTTPGYVLNGGTNGALVTDASRLDIGAGTTTINAAITGINGLTKSGPGTLLLGGANSFAGGYTAATGTTVVASDTALGTDRAVFGDNTVLAASGNRTLANAIAFTGPGTIDSGAGVFNLSGVVSGPGRINKLGTGGLTLTGANSFTGGLTIDAGTVTGAVANLGSGGILNNAALVIAQGVDGTLAQVVSGTGSLTKTGPGTLTVASANIYTGATTVSAGRLALLGSITGSATTVQTGASLSGNGATGALTVQSGGTVTPGSGAGNVATLSVVGGLNLAAGSTFAADVVPTGADRISASGPAAIAGNIVVTPGGLPFTTFQSYTLVSGSARTGTFANATIGNFGAAFAPVLIYDATTVQLRLAPASLVTLGGSGLRPNPLAVAQAFDAAVAGGYNPQAFFALYTQGANLPAALDQLSGEIHAAEQRTLLEDTRIVRETAFDRLSAGLSAIAGAQTSTTETADSATTLWLRGGGTWGVSRDEGIGRRFTSGQAGFLTGIDHARGGFKFGGMFHFTSTKIDFVNLGYSKVESTGGAIYAGFREAGGFAVALGGSIADVKARGRRAITAPGLAQTLGSVTDGTVYQGFGEVAFDLMPAPELRLEPFFRAAYTNAETDGFAETGGIAAIAAGRQSNDLTVLTAGGRGGFDLGGARLSASAGWHRTTGDRDGAIEQTISAVGRSQLIRTVALDRDAAAIEAQASFNLTPKLTMGASYSGIIGKNNTSHGARATLTYGF